MARRIAPNSSAGTSSVTSTKFGLSAGFHVSLSCLPDAGSSSTLWMQAVPLEVMSMCCLLPAISGSSPVIFQPLPGASWSNMVGPVKVSKPQNPSTVPVSSAPVCSLLLEEFDTESLGGDDAASVDASPAVAGDVVREALAG